MTDNNEERLSRELEQLPEIPFSKALQDRIVQGASKMERPSVRSLGWRRTWKPWLAAVGGAGTAAVLLVGVMAHRVHPAPSKLSAAGTPAAYGLQQSALHVLSIRIGNIPGEPQDSSVIAEVKNTGSHTIHRTDVFGVLAFPQSTAKHELLKSESLTFVNGPQSALPPGQKTKWTFHPVGAPHDVSSQGLTEQPYLVFYRSGLKKTAGVKNVTQFGKSPANAVWRRSALKIEHTSMSIRRRGQTAQSFTVGAKVKNVTGHKVNVTKLWGIVWFKPSQPGNAPGKGAWDWSTSGDTRFISSLRTNGTQYIAPGQTLEVYFDLVGSSKSDFLNRTPHVAIIQR